MNLPDYAVFVECTQDDALSASFTMYQTTRDEPGNFMFYIQAKDELDAWIRAKKLLEKEFFLCE